LLSGRRKLLLADDSPTIQKVISLTFGDEGFEVVAVGDGEQALAALDADAPPDVLLADIHMPGPNGYELCERVRADARLRHIPVVLLVGTFEPFNEAEARRVGADTVLTKPFQSIRDLVSRVGSLLGGESKQEEAAQEEPRVEVSAGEPLSAHADVHAQHEQVAHADYYDEHGVESHAEHANAFADFAADDELIEAKHADAFGVAPAQAEPPAREQFASESHGHEAAEPHGHGVAETREHEAFAGSQFESSEPVGTNGHADAGREEAQPVSLEAGLEAEHSTSFAAAPRDAGERAMAAHASFNARAASAASADDALLDLGQMETHASVAASEADDFILDLEDDFSLNAARARHDAGAFEAHAYGEHNSASAQPDAPSAFADAAHGEHASQFVETASVYEEPASRYDEPASSFDAAEVVMQDDPQEFTRHDESHAFGAAPRGFVEPEVVPADAPVPASFESQYTDGSVEGDVAKPPAGLYHTNPMFETATREQAQEMSVAQTKQTDVQENVAASEPSPAGYTVGEARVGHEEALRADQLSPEAVERIARRVVEMMSDKVVREIAWEVVPELAELLIKQRLDEDKR
jgi:CheY-like chemotaxis protein